MHDEYRRFSVWKSTIRMVRLHNHIQFLNTDINQYLYSLYVNQHKCINLYNIVSFLWEISSPLCVYSMSGITNLCYNSKVHRGAYLNMRCSSFLRLNIYCFRKRSYALLKCLLYNCLSVLLRQKLISTFSLIMIKTGLCKFVIAREWSIKKNQARYNIWDCMKVDIFAMFRKGLLVIASPTNFCPVNWHANASQLFGLLFS